MARVSRDRWFSNCGGWQPSLSLSVLRAGIEQGLLDEQDESGLTALSLAVTSEWLEGVEELLRAGANTELRYYRTGETVLYMAVQGHEAMVEALLEKGANPDAANHFGITPRSWRPDLFEHIAVKEVQMPEPRIQNAEHLADHYYPRFKIPERHERESLKPGQAVNLYVYGPRCESKQDTVKVRISARAGRRPKVRYVGIIETPLERTHLVGGTREVEFGPEHVATVFVPRRGRGGPS
jgi:hypothetical protein